MQLKVCGMRDRYNIAALCRLQPDYMGFVFYQRSARAVPEQDRPLQAAIAGIQGIETIGVFVDEPIELLLQTVRAYCLDRVQLHGAESPAYCTEVARYIPVIKAFSIDMAFDWRRPALYEECCSNFLFDTATPQYGGSGTVFDWQLLQYYKGHKPYFLSGGIGPEQAAALKKITDDRLHAIDINSRFEVQPGLKNISLIQTFHHELYY